MYSASLKAFFLTDVAIGSAVGCVTAAGVASRLSHAPTIDARIGIAVVCKYSPHLLWFHDKLILEHVDKLVD